MWHVFRLVSRGGASYSLVSPLVTSYIVVPRLAAVPKQGWPLLSSIIIAISQYDNYIFGRRGHFFIPKNTKNTGIQLITLPWVHYNPAKPAQKDPDPGIFPWRLLSSKLLWYEYSIGHKYEWKCWHQEIHKSTHKHTFTSTLAANIIWMIIRIEPKHLKNDVLICSPILNDLHCSRTNCQKDATTL